MLFIVPIRAYQLALSPFLGQRCRFYPSCSHYALICFHHLKWYQALKLTLKRIVKCHPWHPGGIDIPGDLPKEIKEKVERGEKSY